MLAISCRALIPVLPDASETTLLKPTIKVHNHFLLITKESRPFKTPIQVSLLPVLEEDPTASVLAPEEWTGLPAIKERPSFQFGALNNPTMDLMMLQVE